MDQFSPEQPQFLIEDSKQAYYLAATEDLTRSHFREYPRRADGSSAVDHISRIIELYDSHLGLEPPAGLIAATYLHDRVECLYKSDHPEEQAQLLQDLQTLYNIDSETTQYALGIALSAIKFEEAAEAWRGEVQQILLNSTHPDFETLKLHLNSIIEKQQSTLTTEDLQIRMAQAIKNGKNNISRELLQWRAPMGDIEAMANILQIWDIEGLILKTAEVMDNLRHPNPQRPASAWRDAQELLSFYAPLLEMADFQHLSREAYSYAYRYLNNDPAFFPKNETGEQVPYITPTEEEMDRIRRAYSLYQEGLNFDPEIASLFPVTIESRGQRLRDILGTAEGRIEGRIKHVGSIIEKLKKGKVPDIIGYKLVLPNTYTYPDLKNLVNSLIEQILQDPVLGLVPGHARESEPVVQVNMPEVTQKAKQVITVNHTSLEVHESPPRPASEYSAVHINFYYYSENGERIGVEIQIARDKEDMENTKGKGHHVFYKAAKGIGSIARMRRDMMQDPSTAQEAYNYMISYILSIMGGIEERVKVFQEETRSQKLSEASFQEVQNFLRYFNINNT